MVTAGILGDLWTNMSQEQKDMFYKFKEDMDIPKDFKEIDGVHDDITVYRFLSAKKWVYKDATKQYRAMRKFREDEKVDEIDKWASENKKACELLSKLFPNFHHCFDKDGRPVIIQNVGAIPANRFAKVVKLEDNHKYHIWWMEELMKTCIAQTKKLGKPTYKITVIADLGGCSAASRHLVPFLRDMTKIDEQNYPELAHAIFCVNCPWIFPAMYNLIKPFLDPVTRKKISVYKHKKDFAPPLLKAIDAEQLSTVYGGESTVKMPQVETIDIDKTGDCRMEIKVPSNKSVKLEISGMNDKKGGLFCWNYEAQQDVTLKVEFVGKKQKKLVAVTKEVKGQGEFNSTSIGNLVLTFENTAAETVVVKYFTYFYGYELFKTNEFIETQQRKAKEEKSKNKGKEVEEEEKKLSYDAS